MPCRSRGPEALLLVAPSRAAAVTPQPNLYAPMPTASAAAPPARRGSARGRLDGISLLELELLGPNYYYQYCMWRASAALTESLTDDDT